MHNVFLKQTSKSLPRMQYSWRKMTGMLVCLFSISASGMSADFTDEQLQAMSKDPKSVKAGSKMFQTSCASCHLASNYLSDKDKPAMNLKDGIWYYGGKPTEIYHSISIGNPVKNMTAFGSLLMPSEVAELVAYLLTIQTPADASQAGATAPTSPTPAN